MADTPVYTDSSDRDPLRVAQSQALSEVSADVKRVLDNAAGEDVHDARLRASGEVTRHDRTAANIRAIFGEDGPSPSVPDVRVKKAEMHR